jgi:hypothetical protein
LARADLDLVLIFPGPGVPEGHLRHKHKKEQPEATVTNKKRVEAGARANRAMEITVVSPSASWHSIKWSASA